MAIGWMDFSRSDRERALGVLDRLTEDAILDEMGVGPLRDAFADRFFPGTSTLQTRAKYFFLVPYLLMDLDEATRGVTVWKSLQDKADAAEQASARKLLEGGEKDGVIGRRSLARGSWVRRSPADIYWSGLRRFGIFLGRHTLREYFRTLCRLNREALDLKGKGRLAEREDEERDDPDAGGLFRQRFWNVPPRAENWKENLSLSLTPEEGAFLRNRILAAARGSLLAFLLENDIREVQFCEDFASLERFLPLFPEPLRRDFLLAQRFSHFNACLTLVYNALLGNDEARALLREEAPSFGDAARELDPAALFAALPGTGNFSLLSFLREMREKMLSGDMAGLKEGIRRREERLKGPRARTLSPVDGETRWYGTGLLQYRFGTARRLVCDIFASGD